MTKHDFALAAEDVRRTQDALLSLGIIQRCASGRYFRWRYRYHYRSLRAASGWFLATGPPLTRRRIAIEHDLRLVSAKVEDGDFTMEALPTRSGSRPQGFSMLLYGVAGRVIRIYVSSPSIWVWISWSKSSSLRDKYVGETEKKIASAFAEAEERGMILVLDEANTFMRDRENSPKTGRSRRLKKCWCRWKISSPVPVHDQPVSRY